jgi:hypothetical protein
MYTIILCNSCLVKLKAVISKYYLCSISSGSHRNCWPLCPAPILGHHIHKITIIDIKNKKRSLRVLLKTTITIDKFVIPF